VAVQSAPAAAGIALAHWNWKVVRQFVEARCGIRLCRSACTRYLHRLGCAYKRPKKRLRKADEGERAAFIEEYAAPVPEAQSAGGKIFFADEAHFRADADLHGKWVLKGRPALVDATCPRWGEQASDSSAVRLETGETEYMALAGTSSSATSTTFLEQLRAQHAGPLVVIRDNGPAHGGDAIREYLAIPDRHLRLVRLPAYSPDCNPDEALWAGCARRSPPTPVWTARRRSRSGCSASSPGWRPAPPRSSPAAAVNCKPWPRLSSFPRQRRIPDPSM